MTLLKKTLPALLLVAMAGNYASAQTTYPSGTTGCIARWDFSSSGAITTLPDVSTNGNNGTAYNLVSAPGFRNLSNKAMKFNGTSSRAVVPHTSMLMPSRITMACLVKLDTFYTGLCEGSQIVLKGNPHFISGSYGMAIMDNTYDGNCGTYSPDYMQQGNQFANINQTIPSGNYVRTRKWYFMAASYTGDTVKYYQVEMDTNVYNSNITPIYTQWGFGTPLGSNTMDLTIGYNADPPYPYWLNGTLDELVIFNRALADSSVQSVYNYLWGGIIINKNFSDTSLCLKDTFTVNYTAFNSDHFTTGNTFTVQLSDATGSFATPVSIGSTTSTTSGSITCILPTGITAGTGYKIRVVASTSSLVSPDNNKTLDIHPCGTGIVDNDNAASFKLYPNPNSGSFILNGTVASNEEITLEVFNTLGQSVKKQVIIPANSTIHTEVELGNVANGIYMLHLHTQSGSTTMRIQVNK